MRILFIGDIMGRSGREALETHLPTLKQSLSPDVVIVNVDNAAHGRGVSKKICQGFYDLGVDVLTGGDHVWDQREIVKYIAQDPKLLRPINFAPDTPGNGIVSITAGNGQKITIIHALARTFMKPIDCPFRAVSEALSTHRLGQNTDAIFVDFHGEATSEKMAFGHYFDGKISAMVGTHTHVPTADAHILPKGTGYQTDAGMCGSFDSVIGVEKELAIHRFLKSTPTEQFRPDQGEATLCGTFIVTNDSTGLAQSIEPVRVGGVLSGHMPT